MKSNILDVLAKLGAEGDQGDYARSLELLDQHYVKAPVEDREAVWALMSQDPKLEAAVQEHLSKVSEKARAAEDHPACLRAFLLSVSLGYEYDSRDMLMSLASMWNWAESHQFDPLPLYREIAAISNPEATHIVGGSAQAMIATVAECPSYRERFKGWPGR